MGKERQTSGLLVGGKRASRGKARTVPPVKVSVVRVQVLGKGGDQSNPTGAAKQGPPGRPALMAQAGQVVGHQSRARARKER